jgi:Fe-S cluster biogenesis protein NfuA
MSPGKSDTVEERIRGTIARLRPLLRLSDPPTIDLVSFDARSGLAVLRLGGGCPDCEMPVVALMQGIEAHLKLRVPEIREVRAESTDGAEAAGHSDSPRRP